MIKLDEVIRVYDNAGIVTKKDFEDLDNRVASRELHSRLKEIRKNALMLEVENDDRSDCSNAIFDPDIYDEVEKVEKYMKRYVLFKPNTSNY